MDGVDGVMQTGKRQSPGQAGSGRTRLRSVAALAAAGLMLGAAGTAAAQGWGRWQVDAAGGSPVAAIDNGHARVGMACGADGSPEFRLSAPNSSDVPAGATAILQVSTASDAYPIDGSTQIDTFLLSMSPATGGDGRSYMADPGAGTRLIDSLRTGLNLTVGLDAFSRSERFTLVGSNAALTQALAGCTDLSD